MKRIRPARLVPSAIALFSVLGLVLCATAQPLKAAEVGDSPWAALEEVRQKLAQLGPRNAQFEQTFLAAGFSSGETESGRLALDLPDCLRWDYGEPFPKSFLICGDELHYWNPEDASGRRQIIDARNEPGLDLLLLGIEDLAKRYKATALVDEQGMTVVSLEPVSEEQVIRDASLTLDPEQGQVIRLAYSDREGKRSRFEITDYSPLGSAEVFTPPAGIRWEEEP